MSFRQHGYSWPSLATSHYRSSPLACLQGYIPYPHIAAVCMFELARPEEKIWPQIFFPNFIVLFLMKQVKHNNVFIHYTKYKFSFVT